MRFGCQWDELGVVMVGVCDELVFPESCKNAAQVFLSLDFMNIPSFPLFSWSIQQARM